MNDVLSAVLGSMHADMARVDHAAMNLANVQTAGYQRTGVSFMPFAARVDAFEPGSEAPVVNAVRVHTDRRPGTLKATGQSLDLAIVGDGWFEVATEQGVSYTRQGTFRLDGRGRLVTQQGRAVLGTAGEIQLIHGSPVVDAAGKVYDVAGATGLGRGATTPVAQLKIVRFDEDATITRVGDGLVTTPSAAVSVAEGSVQIEQGFLENSNVSHMHEMVRLMESVRHMESLQRAAMALDEMLGTSIRRLGEQ
jgi:flagellar basal-body rod protein FlgG